MITTGYETAETDTITLTADEAKRLREFLAATELGSPTCECEWCKKRRAVADIKLGEK